MGTVGASAALGGLVDLDVLDNKVASVKTLGVGVGLSVLQEVDEELGGLLGPASLADTELLACRTQLAKVLRMSLAKRHDPFPNTRHPSHSNSQDPSSFAPFLLAHIQSFHNPSRTIIHLM